MLKAETALAVPFAIDSYGNIVVATTQEKIWADRVRSVIGTSLKERVMRPEIGSLVAKSVYDNQEEAAQSIKAEIEYAFDNQLTLLKLNEVSVSNDVTTGHIFATVIYELPNTKKVETTLGVAYLNGKSPIYEENL